LAINLREELMGEQIGVTLLSPGATATRMWEGEDVPANRLLNPNDIAEVVATVMRLSPQAVLDEVVMRPMHGEPHA
jgi:NADP-dependent 3-hydroxy acid dehydrogenase YdfG